MNRATSIRLRAPCAIALASLAFSVSCRADDSPHKWTEFETVAGQPNPVPKRWLATPNGRLTHNIVLPDSLPKPVPFDFTAARLKALLPFAPSADDQYWRHLCATEAGQYIFKTVKSVEGLVLMRISTVAPKDEDKADLDSWMYEAGFIEVPLTQRNEPENFAGVFINWPYYTYRTAEVPNSFGSQWTRITRTVDESANGSSQSAVASGKWRREPIEAPTERYAVTWRGLVRPNDRQSRIAGFELIVFDRQTNEVLSVVRNFQHGKWTWRNAAGCEEMLTSYASPSDMPEVLLALRTLQTTQPSVFLRSNDERISRRAGK